MAEYEDKIPEPVRYRAGAWDRRAYDAEWDVPEGRAGQVIIQLRQRGRAANVRGNLMLVALVITILAGLAFYIGRPLIETWADGRRSTLEAELSARDADITALDERRNALQADLVDRLKLRAETVHKHDGGRVSDPILLPDNAGVLVMGANDNLDGRILRAGPDGRTWETVHRHDGGVVWFPILLPDNAGVLVMGWDGSILRAGPDGRTWETVHTHDGGRVSDPILLPDNAGVLVLSADGRILRAGPDGRTWETVHRHDGGGVSDPILLPDNAGVLVLGEDGSILRAGPDGTTWETVHRHDGGGVWHPILLPDNAGVLVMGAKVNGDGSILRAGPDGRTWETVHRHDGGWVWDPILLPDNAGVLVMGTNNNGGDGSILRAGPDGTTWETVHRHDGGGAQSPILLPDNAGVLVLGANDNGDGSILRAGPDGRTWETVHRHDGGGVQSPILLPDNAGVLVLGEDGRILRAGPDGRTWETVHRHDGGSVQSPILLPDNAGVLVMGTETNRHGSILKLSDRLSRAVAAPLQEGREGDDALIAFLDTLPSAYLSEITADHRVEAVVIRGDRLQALAAIDRIRTDIDPLGPKAPTKDVAQLLSETVPPSILLLFLLATLAALYRYNIRLAGFHHSRADALFLATSDGPLDPERLDRIAGAIAADKVEFRTTNTPADQATEVAKVLAARIKP